MSFICFLEYQFRRPLANCKGMVLQNKLNLISVAGDRFSGGRYRSTIGSETTDSVIDFSRDVCQQVDTVKICGLISRHCTL